MLSAFFRFSYWITGWSIKGGLSEGLKKCVIVVAPHTSYWDFYLGVATRAIQGFRANYLVKAELFKYKPVAWFMSITGGIPVDRKSKKQNVVEQITQFYEKRESLILAIAPEGTRKKVETFKTGFYRIAHKAKVPIVLVAFDFGKKEVRFMEEFNTSGDMEKDMSYIIKQFDGVKGLHPELGIG
ncbi:MAG: 1-acyl-sn-glycerol-3-phosphate acyltransferase [Reichenbachiella sp.]